MHRALFPPTTIALGSQTHLLLYCIFTRSPGGLRVPQSLHRLQSPHEPCHKAHTPHTAVRTRATHRLISDHCRVEWWTRDDRPGPRARATKRSVAQRQPSQTQHRGVDISPPPRLHLPRVEARRAEARRTHTHLHAPPTLRSQSLTAERIHVPSATIRTLSDACSRFLRMQPAYAHLHAAGGRYSVFEL